MKAKKNLISRREAVCLGGLATAAIALRSRAEDAGGAVVLENERLRVAVDPANGARLLAFAVKRDGRWLDVSPDGRAAGSTTKACSWMMIPYSNRIENGVFRFEGKEFQLKNGAAHAIHGDARNHPWKIAEQKSALLKCSLRSADFSDFNWPWPIDIGAEFSLEGNVFAQRLTIRNRGSTTMPAGFGWHPYYLRTLTQPDEPALLQMKFAGVYPDTNGNCIPSGPAAAPTADFDFSKPFAIPHDRKYDHCMSGYDGKGSIEWPRSGVKLEYDCSPNVTHLVFYNPPDKPFFAVEPAANANNGVNLLDRGDPTSGVIALPAGDELKANFSIKVTA